MTEKENVHWRLHLESLDRQKEFYEKEAIHLQRCLLMDILVDLQDKICFNIEPITKEAKLIDQGKNNGLIEAISLIQERYENI